MDEQSANRDSAFLERLFLLKCYGDVEIAEGWRRPVVKDVGENSRVYHFRSCPPLPPEDDAMESLLYGVDHICLHGGYAWLVLKGGAFCWEEIHPRIMAYLKAEPPTALGEFKGEYGRVRFEREGWRGSGGALTN